MPASARFSLFLFVLMATAACGGDKIAADSAEKQIQEETKQMQTRDPFAAARDIAAPAVEKKPVEITQHGETRTDNYAWLKVDNWQEVLQDPSLLADDVRAVLEAENAYYEAVTDDLEPLRKKLFAEMRARVKENDASVPLPDGPWKYWYEYREGGEYPIFLRAPRDSDDRQIIYDGDAERGESKFFSIGDVAHSPNHKLAAYTVDRLGSEYYTISVRNLETGEDLNDTIERADGDSLVWMSDSGGFYYIERDDNNRPKRVKRHMLGTDTAEDALIYEESDDGFFLGVGDSQSGEYIFITTSNAISSEVRFLKADSTDASPTLIAAREDNVEYYVDHHGDDFYIYTNEGGAVDFKIAKAPIAAPGRENWTDWLPHRPGTYVTTFTPYKDYLVRLERSNALPRLVISTYDGESHEVSFDEAAYSLGMSSGYEYDTKTLRFSYESPSTPEETFDYDLESRERMLLKRQEVPSGHDKDRYVVERFTAEAPDGAQVPVTLLRLKSTPVDGTAPIVLYGYGSYGATMPANFSTNILPIVDRRVMWVTAHPRGGAALGRQWYLDGKLGKKMNTFTDFNAVADALIEKNYTQQKNIVIYGGSAGGLLVGAAVNLRPELYAGVVAAVPFVDVINTISDGELPLTPPEWEEWGNPITDAEAYGWIREYSPYENIQNVDYPPIMATGGLTDYRVTYWEMAKWVARLRDDAKGGPFVLRMNMGAGHGGSAARFERLDERAHLYSFALKAVGKDKAEPEPLEP